jgi:hypothetical protein
MWPYRHRRWQTRKKYLSFAFYLRRLRTFPDSALGLIPQQPFVSDLAVAAINHAGGWG